jgi:hypothetical protein
MAWIEGTPPKDGNMHVCRSLSYDGPVMLYWSKCNGLEAFRDWDLDTYQDVTHWHPLEGYDTKEPNDG